MTHPNRYRILFFTLAVVVLLVVPTRPVGVADGLPVDHPLELWIAFLLAGGFFVLPWRAETRRAPRLALLLAVVALAKLAVASVSLPHGLLARYYANPDFRGPPEASVEYTIAGATRLDRTIDFAHVGFAWDKKPFPIWFFNDKMRFNFFKPDQPDRKRLPFSVRWDGFIRAPTREPFAWRLVTEQEATLSLMGQGLLSTSKGEAEARVALEPGWYPISLTYVHRGEGPRSLRLEWAPQGEFRPVPASALLPIKPSEAAERWDRRAASAAWAVFVFQFLAVAWLLASGLKGLSRESVLTERAAVFLMVALMAALGTASLAKRGRTPHWNILNGGDDPLTYESASRQIIIERDLLNTEKGPRPFHNMVGYRYYLAVVHLLLGESKAMVVMTHYFLLAASCALLYYMVRRMAPPGPSLLGAFLLFSGQAHGTVYRWATELFPAILGLALVGALLLGLARWAERRTTPRALVAGALAGLATVVRPNILSFVPLALLWMVFTPNASRSQRWKGAAAAFLACALLIAPVTWRNWHVSGRFALLVGSVPIMLHVGNEPPPGSVDYSRIDSDPLYERLKLEPDTRKVLEYLRQMPGNFMKGLGRKLLQTLGFVDPLAPSLISLHLGYIVGALLLWRAGVARWLASLLHSFVLSQWVVLVIFKPWPHLPKTQLPTFFVAFCFTALLAVSWAYAALEGCSPTGIMPTAPPWGTYRRVLGGAASLALLAVVTYPPRLPIIIPLLLVAVWTLRRGYSRQVGAILDSLKSPSPSGLRRG